MQKPDVDHIDGLSPAISIEQRTAGGNPRSIVATTTEIHDYLRLLFANIGKRHCPKCGKPVTTQNAEDMVEQLLALPEKTRVMLLAPMIAGRKGEHESVFDDIRQQGFVRVRVNGEICDLDSLPKLDKRKNHTIEAVVDRLSINADARGRITDSVEIALKTSDGSLIALVEKAKDEWDERAFSEKNACLDCGISFDELLPRNFSFNSPYGACPECAGLGSILQFDADLVIPDKTLPLEKAIHAWRRGGHGRIVYYKKLLSGLSAAYGLDEKTKVEDLPADFMDALLNGTDESISYYMYRRKITKPFEGILRNLERWYEETENENVQIRLRDYMTRMLCPACHGARLRPESLAVLINGTNMQDVMTMSVIDASAFFEELELSGNEAMIAKEILKEVRQRLKFLLNVGLGYLTLNRESGSLSGGEAQRIRLATQVGAGLVGVLYVLDEPSIGLHQRDNQRLLDTLHGLRDLGNTVIVVEHDEQTIREADFVIDLGPGAGSEGGQIMFAGTVPELLKSEKSLTAQYINGLKKIEVPHTRLSPSKETGWIEVIDAEENNLQKVSAQFPLGLMTCVTGVSGSGKSTLVDTILKRALFRHFHHSKERPGKHKEVRGMELVDKVVVIDQSPIGRTPRSNPVTYTGAFTDIRDLFASLPASKMRGYKPGRFSFNVKGGRCERCKGDGVLKVEMNFLPDVYVPCEQCHEKRYNKETLEVRYHGKSISDILDMTIDDALPFFENIPKIQRKLRTLVDVGLGYLKLGQPATTLSGGEAQRIKLATELSKRATGKTLYLLDEPTTGLHFGDVHRLLEVLERLRDEGNSLIIIEHNLDVIKRADYIVDLGPEGGTGGGTIVAQGTPEEVVTCAASYTGQFLKEVL
jgi:excinuclease ABC subunit A